MSLKYSTKSFSFLSIIFAFTFIFQSCGGDDSSEDMGVEIVTPDPDPNPEQETVARTILLLGASRVQGNRPNYESFRFELWKKLNEGGFDFDFIGTITDNTTYPDPFNESFDRDHEGRGGITSTGILEGIEDWLEDLKTSPDIVIFSSPGGNDPGKGILTNTSFSNIRAIIDILQQDNPNITIILEEIAPPNTNVFTDDFFEIFLTSVHREVRVIVEEKSTSTSTITTVDMHTGFTDELLADNVHYNEDGAVFIAERHFDVLQSLLEKLLI